MRTKLFRLAAIACLLLITGPTMAHHFDFSSPTRTWATFKFALDTRDYRLFKSCLHPDEAAAVNHAGFEKFLHGDGRFAQTSRVVKQSIDGETAELSIDFFCQERDGRLLIDNDPIRFVRVEGKWLIEGI